MIMPSINGRTQVIVHLAWPSVHLRTPSFFNPRMIERGIDAVLVPWQVKPEALTQVWDALRHCESVAGVIVTIPHKISVAGLCDRLEGDAALLKVANVARRHADGTFTGAMFDGEAYVAGLRQQGHEPRGKKILLVGAGGAGTAIAFSLARAGVEKLTISNRDQEKADKLAGQVGAVWPLVNVTAGDNAPQGYDIIINATALGLKAGDAMPFDPDCLDPGALAAEVVMNPAETPVLTAAAARGNPIHQGEHMITAQIDLLADFILRGDDKKLVDNNA